MDLDKRREVEDDIKRRAERGDLQGAASLAIRAYGTEIFELLAALHRSDVDAAEVFSMFAEKLWRFLPSFRWDASFRTWAYTVARTASLDFRRAEKRRVARVAPLADGSMLSELAAEVRDVTQSYLKTDRRDRFAEIRSRLDPDDQELLMLRVDRGLAWDELAVVLHGASEPPLTPETKKRAAARLRKRFQLLKEKLYEMGRAEGIVSDDKDGQ